MRLSVGVLLTVLLSVSLTTDSFGSQINEFSSFQYDVDYDCDENGYIGYLNQWSITEKSSSRNATSQEFQQRLQYFKNNCLKIHKWNSKDKFKLDFTYYVDWSADEFDMLGASTQRYTGMKPDIFETEIFLNNTNYRSLLPSIDPCDDVLKEGENTLRETINKPQNCSVSWAFAITNSIEYAVKKMYKEEYEQDVDIALSAQELIDCVGKDHGIENGCEGIPVSWGFDYVFENGIAYRHYYPHTNVYGECKEIPKEHKYHIAGYEKPEVYNKYGLSGLLKKGPVAVTLGLDPEYFQFYQNDRETGPYFNTGYYRPSVYGVLLESNQYKEDGLEEFAEWPYFSIETRLRACDSMIFRLPILESVENANIGGIAGFAIRPVVSDPVPTSFTCNENIYPTIEAIPVYATELIFEENSYPNIQTLDLSRFTQLRTLIIKNGTFTNCYSVHLDNPDLAVIEIGDNCFTGFPAAFVIANAPNLSTFKIGTGSLTNVTSIEIGKVSDSVEMTVGSGSFSNVEKVNIDDSNISQGFGNSLAGAIENANPGKTVDVIVIRPTEAPTTLPTTTQPPTTQPPTTLPPTTQLPTTLPPTTLPPTTQPPTTQPPTTQPPTTQPPTTQPPTTLPPTTLPPSTQPPTTLPPYDCNITESLIIRSDSDCYKLQQNGWKQITVYSGYCNSITSDLSLSNNPCLVSIYISNKSLNNLNSLMIYNNPELSSIVFYDGSSTTTCALCNVKTVTISSYSFFVMTSNRSSEVIFIENRQIFILFIH